MTILSIALSSFRLHLIKKVVDGILKGTQLPDAIIVNFSEEPFFSDKGLYRTELPIFESNVVECYKVENIGPMRAYIPVIEMFKDKPNTTITILDDDLGISENTISDLLYYCEKLNCAVGLAGYNIGRGKYFFKGTNWSYLVKEPEKVHIPFSGWGTTFKIRHLHKSILDWRKYKNLELEYDNEPYLAYMLAKQETDRYVIPSEKIQMYASEFNLNTNKKSQFVKEMQFKEFYKIITGDSIELTGKEIIYGKEE